MSVQNLLERKNKLKDYMERLLKLGWVQDLPEGKQLKELTVFLEKENFTVVVLGEFSRGKSTFINALLGKSLLPMDVLPETAVLSALLYGDEPEATIIYCDGHRERGQADGQYLSQFSAQSGRHEDISYIQLKYPAHILKGKIVLVDTPGVSDLDEQRAEITYGFLPQADAVIFLLDATAPLKKTEKEFLLKRVLPQGIQQIIFVANKADNLDEEENEDYEDCLRQRLKKVFGDKVELFLVSSRMALHGREHGKEQLLAESGLPALEARMMELFASGQREYIKIIRLEDRCRRLVQQLIRRCQSGQTLASLDGKELHRKQKILHNLLDARKQDADQIDVYLQKQEQQILQMLDKSLKYFNDRLTDEAVAQVDAYKGADFKEFVDVRLKRQIQREIENWLALYGPRLEHMIQQLAQSVSQGLARRFTKQVKLHALPRGWVRPKDYHLQLEAQDISNTDVAAGAIAAAGGIGLTLAVGGALMPFISFAAMPLLRRQMLEHRLTTAKDELLPELQQQITACMLELLQDLHERVSALCSQTATQVRDAYDNLLYSYQQEINAQIELRQQDELAVSNRLQEWIQRMGELSKLTN